METAYKLRAIPLVVGLLTLATGFVLRLFEPAAEASIIRWGILITVIGVVFLQAMRQLEKERRMARQPGEHSADAQKLELVNQEYKRKSAIPFLAVRAVLSCIACLLGASLIADGKFAWGIILFLFGGGLCYLHIYWIVKNMRELKKLKEVEKNDDS